MNIDRNHIQCTFAAYTDKYDSTDPKIKLKIDHTYRVAALCDQISDSLNLSDNDKDLAWCLGMFHDIGRFEQIKRFGTFNDATSIDHARLSADLLFIDNLIESYSCNPSSEEARIIELAIRQHNQFRLPEELTDRELLFCNIIRDADKIDILKVNVETPAESIYNISLQELKQSKITPEVIDMFYTKSAVLRSLKRAPIDNLVGHISLVFELVFPISRIIVKNQGYLDIMLDFKSDNPDTNDEFMKMKAFMDQFLS